VKEECPVCGRKSKTKTGVSSHLFKCKDEKHINYIENMNKTIINNFSIMKSPYELDVYCSPYYIRKIWDTIPENKDRKKLANSTSLKKQWKKGTRTVPKGLTNKNYKYSLNHKHTISETAKNTIIELFNSNLTSKEISIKASCDVKTVIPVFRRYFSDEEVDERIKRILKLASIKSGVSNSLKVKFPEKYKNIVKEFNDTNGLKTIAEKYKTGTGAVKKIWIEKFGKKAYEGRLAMMLKLQKERAGKSLKKAKFLGSKNERLCYSLLKESIEYNVKHHDYSVVPRLEIDITIPDLKIAICWDGIGHRKPVFGKKPYNKVVKNDKIRKLILDRKKWTHISVVDNGSHNKEFVKEKVKDIIKIINDGNQQYIEI